MSTSAGSTAAAPGRPVRDSGSITDVRRRIVQAAMRAPSVHNTQPWRFASCAEGLDLYAEEARRLAVLDPRGRQLHLSCGAALLHAQVAARGFGLIAEPQLLPDADDPSHLARLRLTPGAAPTEAERGLAEAIELRHTYREAFDPQPLPDELLERLRMAAESQGAYLRVLTDSDDLLVLQAVLDRADRAEGADPAYRQELASWVHTGAAADGIPTSALPADAQRGSSLHLRDFAPDAGPGAADASSIEPSSIDPGSADPSDGEGSPPVAERPEVVVIVSDDDTPLSWLHAGRALGAVLLQAAHEGVMAQPLAQATDLPGSRQRLRAVLGLIGTPQLALRMGYATGIAATPRRDLADVLDRQGQELAGD